MIKEWQIPSTIEILMEMRSSGTLSIVVSGIIKDLIDQENSSIQAPVVQKSVIEKPANNLCKSLPNVAGQDTIRLSQAEIVEPKFSGKSTETLNLVLQRSGGNKTEAKVSVVPQPV